MQPSKAFLRNGLSKECRKCKRRDGTAGGGGRTALNLFHGIELSPFAPTSQQAAALLNCFIPSFFVKHTELYRNDEAI